MRKRTKAMTIALSSALLIGLTSMSNIGIINGDNKNDESIKRILWEHGGDLEAQFGQQKNIGTAGLLAGKSGDYIIAGGGANFPDKPVVDRGPKKLYPDVYVLKQEDGKLKQVNHTQLKYEIGYGSSITTDEGVYYIGGSTDNNEADNVTLFTVDKKGKLKSKHIGDLPFTFSDGIAVKEGKYIYVGLGKQDGKASNKMYRFDTKTGKTKEIAAMPGAETRTQSVAQILDDELYVFSGGGKISNTDEFDIAHTDGYKYDMEDNEWEQVSDVELNGKDISLLGASSVKINDEEMLVIGGFNKEVYDNAVSNLGSLQGEQLEEFRQKYFGADPHEFNWNKNILIYNAEDDAWRSVGEVPFNAPCGAGVVKDGNKIYSINGEIKPGVRTERTFVGTIFNK